MRTDTFHLELITPCFSGGAEPERQAELRAPSIRGQLRWWFRTLGGFKSLARMPVSDQEAMIFGSAAGEDGHGGRLCLRVRRLTGRPMQVTDQLADVGREKLGTPRAYLLFPLRDKPREGFWSSSLPSFELRVDWRGSGAEWPKPVDREEDVRALVALFASLGALGHRSRRGFGALAAAPSTPLLSLDLALARFQAETNIAMRELHCTSSPFVSLVHVENTVVGKENQRRATKGRPPLPTLNFGTFRDGLHVAEALGVWLKAWRFRGKAPHWLNPHASNPKLGFDLLEDDHAAGRGSFQGPVNRAALGLPIVQKFSSAPEVTVNWEWEWNPARHKGEGRFASPVLLRPHRDAQGKWHALVIFVDVHKWPNDPNTGRPKQVSLNGRALEVSLDLYDAMKADAPGFLKPFP